MAVSFREIGLLTVGAATGSAASQFAGDTSSSLVVLSFDQNRNALLPQVVFIGTTIATGVLGSWVFGGGPLGKGVVAGASSTAALALLENFLGGETVAGQMSGSRTLPSHSSVGQRGVPASRSLAREST